MKFKFLILLALLSGCSSTNDFKDKIIGTWEIYSLDGKTDLYKSFVGTSITFTSDGSYSRSSGSKTYGQAKYNVKGDVLTIERRKKTHSSVINFKNLELHIEKDPGFTRGGKPRKSVYKRK